MSIQVVELAHGSALEMGGIGGIAITTAVNTHYVLSDKDGKKAQSLAFRFDLPDRSLVYTGDTGPSESVEALAKNVDVLICEIMDPETALKKLQKTRAGGAASTFEGIANRFRRQHLSPEEVGLMAKRSGAESLVLTHNALDDEALSAARQKIAVHFSGPIRFAEDLESF